MEKADVEHLAALARIELTPAEVESFAVEMSAILSYVGTVKKLALESHESSEPVLTPRYNVFRQDQVEHAADQYTEDLLAEMPKTEGRFLVVKKILQTE